MNAVRVFLVDDTAVVRRILVQILEEDPGIIVVGTAPDGAEGLRRLGRIEVDVVVLDMEMPGMGGLEMLAALRRENLDLPVIVFSSLTERGAMMTIEALSLGASDYVTKPTMIGSPAAARDYVKTALLPKVRVLGRRAQSRQPAAHLPPPQPPHVAPCPPAMPVSVARASRVDVVVIGISTGGPNALGELIPQLPRDLPVPVLVVQHMPALFTRALAQRLDTHAALTVSECDVPTVVTSGKLLLAAGGYHLRLARNGADTWAQPVLSEPVNFCRPSVDVLFASAADVYGANVLAVVMTGMGQDGLEGSRTIRERGGQVIVQDEASSIVWGMPGAVQAAGLAQACCPLAELPREIIRRVMVARSWSTTVTGAATGRKVLP